MQSPEQPENLKLKHHKLFTGFVRSDNSDLNFEMSSFPFISEPDFCVSGSLLSQVKDFKKDFGETQQLNLSIRVSFPS